MPFHPRTETTLQGEHVVHEVAAMTVHGPLLLYCTLLKLEFPLLQLSSYVGGGSETRKDGRKGGLMGERFHRHFPVKIQKFQIQNSRFLSLSKR